MNSIHLNIRGFIFRLYPEILFRPMLWLGLLLIFFSSCSGQGSPGNTDKSNLPASSVSQWSGLRLNYDSTLQIADYVVSIFEDSHGGLWFGTIEKGVAYYDGKALVYFSTDDGLAGNTVSCITEDREENLWFGTHSGLSRFDGKMFTNYTPNEGLCNNRVSSLWMDRSGNLWVGTWGGVCRWTGDGFSDFLIPFPDVEKPLNPVTMYWITEIMEDRSGNIWFGRDGYGACRYNPTMGAFTHFTKKDGLCSNNVQAIHQDRKGNIWFGCRVAEKDNPVGTDRTGDGGLTKYDGERFIQFPQYEGLHRNDVYTIGEDNAGNLWISATGYAVYTYDGENFTAYTHTDRMDLTYVMGMQAVLEDKRERLWFGFSGGLFRFTGSSIINVTNGGPWD